MFQSFTGNSRRPRQVDLSGRNSNPFAGYTAPRHSPAAPASQITLANAQHERLLRQQERDRQNAVRIIQRNWRGHESRQRTKDRWRREWDYREGIHGENAAFIKTVREHAHDVQAEATGYRSEDECMSQLQLLLLFASPSNADDIPRLERFSRRLLQTFEKMPSDSMRSESFLQLTKVALDVLLRDDVHQLRETTIHTYLSLVAFFARAIPKRVAENGALYYRTLASLTVRRLQFEASKSTLRDLIIDCVLGLLQSLSPHTLAAYEGFAIHYLTTTNLPKYLGGLDTLAAALNFKLLASSMASSLKFGVSGQEWTKLNEDERLWLLAYFICFHRHAYGLQVSTRHLPEPDYITVVSSLLCSVADQVSARVDPEVYRSMKDADTRHVHERASIPLPHFIRQEVLSLVDQGSITSLLAHTDDLTRPEPTSTPDSVVEGAGMLASYALTLLRVFPRRGDDIRMWLYLGSALIPSGSTGNPTEKLPAIKYFWNAARNTHIYESISRATNAAVRLLKFSSPDGTNIAVSDIDQEWRIVLLFLELYTFVLKVMDDEEFLSGGGSRSPGEPNPNSTWTRESALPLRDVSNLTTFLKNLAFAMYWNATDLSGGEDDDVDGGIASYFITSSTLRTDGQNKSTALRAYDKKLAGVNGMSLDYLKGTVTGLLRMVYERE